MARRHVISLVVVYLVAYVPVAVTRAGDRPQALADAMDALTQCESWSWTSETSTSRESRFRGGPIQGTVERNGDSYAVITLRRQPTHVVIRGDIAVVTDRDGSWQTISLRDQSYRSHGWAATLAQMAKPPVAEARTLSESISSWRRDEQGYVGVLTEREARRRLQTSSQRDDDFVVVSGEVRFELLDGRLSRYVVHVEGTFREGPEETATWWETEVAIMNVNAAKIVLPEGAAAALRRPTPPPQPALSAAEEQEILTRYGKCDAAVHDPSSIVKCEQQYWFFATGNGISTWHSRDLRAWQRGPRVFRTIPAWVTDVVPSQRGHFWAPDVIHHNDRYWVYYSVSSFGLNTSAIALVSTKTLDPQSPSYVWTDHGIVIQSDGENDYNTIDPAVIATDTGELWMAFGSYWSGLKLVQLDPKTGKRIAADSPLYSNASHEAIEAPHIYLHDGYFYLFVNWDTCCRGVESTYNIRVGRSRTITGPYVDREGVDLLDGGGTLLLTTEGPFIGPGHANVFRDGERYWLSCHYYDGTERGRSRLAIRPLTWSEDGWPILRNGLPDDSP
ncbi:MAG: arabinan endo-1,5-alpha-L-arabinosidase [Planctomycetales bacterium]|nr:arabinan endo-1,5-alpha-L-arabinosidase [Planctomycetales bacterium]